MKSFLIALFIALPVVSFSQCMLYEVPLNTRITESSLIAEGEVKSYRVERREDNNIYTIHTIELYRVFKGNKDKNTIEVITKGGAMEDAIHVVTPSLQLSNNQFGMFFLEPDNQQASIYKPYAGPQGFVIYNEQGNSGSDPLTSYFDLYNDLIKKITLQTGETVQINKKRTPAKVDNSKSSSPVSSFSPASITAGTKSVLTITGNNFGVSRGTGRVEFQNASIGPATITPFASEYISWTNKEIKLHVPSAAGTGAFAVIKSGTNSSPTPLRIDFAQLNTFTSNGFSYQVAHINDNNKGGYDWRFSNDFASNNNAENSFIRAFENWREATCVNWELIENTPANSTNNDGTNIIRFGNTNELPNGVLATTSSYYAACSAGTVWYVSEIDMTYSPDVTWNFDQGSPKNSEFDIESVTLHELGHAHQLGHVIDPDDIMHRSIGPGTTKRKLTAMNITAGNFVQAQSLSTNKCGPSAMLSYPGCVSTIGFSDNNDNNLNFEVYPNPAIDAINIKWKEGNATKVDYSVLDARGKVIRNGRVKKGTTTIQRDNLAPGMYFIRLSAGESVSYAKLILQ